MLGFLHYGLATANHRFGVDQVGRVERRTALFALVAVGTVVAAVGAGAHDVAVGQKLLGLLVVVLLRGLLDKLTALVQLLEELRSGCVVGWGGGTREDIERNAQSLERVANNLVVLIHDILWGYPLLLSLYGDRYPVLVGTAYVNHVFAA